MRKFVKNTLLIFNILAIASLLFAYLSAYISPSDFSYFAVFGLLYPYMLIINLLFFTFWIYLKRKLWLLSAIAILIGWGFGADFFQINFNKKKFKTNQQKIKVLSYNVRVFNLWNWSKEKNRAIKTYHFIKNTNADIVCLQEFYSSNRYGKNSIDSLTNNSQLQYKYVSFAKNKKKIYHHGIAIFSKYPIIKQGNVQLGNYENFCIYADIKVNTDTLRIYNVHLASIHLGNDDYQAIDNINNDTAINVVKYTNILKKLKKAYVKRARQADIISGHIKQSPHEVIVCGDFNDSPVSYAYHQISHSLNDAFKRSGWGISSTFIHKLSAYRIDYILHSPNLKSYNYHRVKVELSDHYPIECDFLIE